jgi:nicotinate-nucleotide pyrophosphorylase (carboxylating)
VKELLEIGVDRIMLDNFSIDHMKKAVSMVAGRVELEASGGITLKSAGDVALTGVDCISVGEITHSVKALDISMTIEAVL